MQLIMDLLGGAQRTLKLNTDAMQRYPNAKFHSLWQKWEDWSEVARDEEKEKKKKKPQKRYRSEWLWNFDGNQNDMWYVRKV